MILRILKFPKVRCVQ